MLYSFIFGKCIPNSKSLVLFIFEDEINFFYSHLCIFLILQQVMITNQRVTVIA